MPGRECLKEPREESENSPGNEDSHVAKSCLLRGLGTRQALLACHALGSASLPCVSMHLIL